MSQVMDEGQLTDSHGKRVDFKNALLVLTSNLGAAQLAALPEGASAEDARPQVMEEVAKAFAPEFVNRLDQIVLFNRLQREQIVEITVHRSRRDTGCPSPPSLPPFPPSISLSLPLLPSLSPCPHPSLPPSRPPLITSSHPLSVSPSLSTCYHGRPRSACQPTMPLSHPLSLSHDPPTSASLIPMTFWTLPTTSPSTIPPATPHTPHTHHLYPDTMIETYFLLPSSPLHFNKPPLPSPLKSFCLVSPPPPSRRSLERTLTSTPPRPLARPSNSTKLNRVSPPPTGSTCAPPPPPSSGSLTRGMTPRMGPGL